jgi:hypothetical protein
MIFRNWNRIVWHAVAIAVAAVPYPGVPHLAMAGPGTVLADTGGIKVDDGVGAGDYVVFAVTASNRVLVGKYETWSDHDPGRTVVREYDECGASSGAFVFPDGCFASAIYGSGSSIYALARGEDQEFKLMELGRNGVVWQHTLACLLGKRGEELKLRFDAADWTRVFITSQKHRGKLTLLWNSESCQPEVGSLEFVQETGRVIRFTAGVVSEAGAVYQADGDGLQRNLNGRQEALPAFEDRRHTCYFDYLDGKLGYQLAEKPSVECAFRDLDTNAFLAGAGVPAAARNNGTWFYWFVPGRHEIRLRKMH